MGGWKIIPNNLALKFTLTANMSYKQRNIGNGMFNLSQLQCTNPKKSLSQVNLDQSDFDELILDEVFEEPLDIIPSQHQASEEKNTEESSDVEAAHGDRYTIFLLVLFLHYELYCVKKLSAKSGQFCSTNN